MKRKWIMMTIALLCALAQGALAQGELGNLTKTVSAADVKVTAVNDAYFTDEGFVVVSPDEDPKAALARRRASGLKEAGSGKLVGAKLYSYTYPSVDADGNEVTLSSLMAVPSKIFVGGVNTQPSNVVIGCHVTITSNFECPTEYNESGGWGSWKTDVGMLIDYTRNDAFRQPCCLVILPDYEGYGVSKNRAHPYLYQELTARQVVDAVRYGLKLYKDNKEQYDFASLEENWKSVCIGYSQGGSVSLATHRFIEENGLADELHFAGSVCGDGPYDPMAHLGYYMNDNGKTYDGTNRTKHEKATVSMPIVMPLILKGMCDRNPFMRKHQVSDYLSEKFLRTGVIDFINAKSNENKDRQYSTDKINEAFRNMRANGQKYTVTDEQGAQTECSYSATEMQQMLYKDDGDNVHGKLSEMMTELAFDYFNRLNSRSTVPSERGVMKDLHRALASNARVSGWTPTHRIGFYHSTYDTVVPYDNLLSFITHQNGLNYYFNSRDRSQTAGIYPSHIVVDEGNADVYIYDDHTDNDHVKAGRSFYFMGVPSPDYKLMKWVVEGKKAGAPSPASSDNSLTTVTLQNGNGTVTAEAIMNYPTLIIGNGQNACIPQYTEGAITIPGTVNIGGQEYKVVVNQLAFRLCNKLTEVTIGEGVKRIGDFAFVGCSSLQKVTLPSTLESIGGGAFVNLPNLTEVKCNATEAPAWENNDLFAYEGTAAATAKLASQRTLNVPRVSGNSYRNKKYNNMVGWADAFGLISEATAPTKTLEISSFDELYNLAISVNGGNDMKDYTIRLTADLIMNGDNRNNWYALTPIGTAEHPFSGVFDGQGHTIKNVKTYLDNYTNVGLFGYTDGAIIRNLILQNISLKGTSNVGVVVGNANYSMIHDVLVYKAVATNGDEYYCAEATAGNAGGLVGCANTTTIIDSYFYGKVKGIIAAGGIVGETASVNVGDCAAGHSVESTGIAGGIVGKAGTATEVARCYSRCTLTAATVGSIVGQAQDDDESAIGFCAYLDASGTLPVVSGNVKKILKTGNRTCATVSNMEGLNLQDLLGDEKWYYFQGDISDCPVPASLADDYLVWAGMKDANGFVFAPNDIVASSYGIVGYEGSATELTLPSTYKEKPVTKVGDRAFKGSNITKMTIPNSITAIGTEAFADCADLVNFSMGSGVTSAYNSWLKNCPKVASLNVKEGNTAYCYENNALYNVGKTRLIRCGTTIQGILTLPSTVTTIEAGAFANCDDLTVVDLRDAGTDWTVNRSLPSSPFYNASKYTLFIMNQASWAHNNVSSEPNVVNLRNGYLDGGYECMNLYLTDRLGINLGAGAFHFNAVSTHYDRKFETTLAYGQGDNADYVYQPKAYTLIVPFKIHLKAGKGAKLYRYNKVTTEDNVTTVVFQEVGKNDGGYYSTSASHPYYLVVESGDPFTLESASISNVQGAGSQYENGDYAYVGTYVKIDNEHLYDASQPKYILQSDGNWHQVPQGEPKAYVGPFRAYFRAKSTSAARALYTSFGDGDETGINQTVVRTIDHDGTEHYYDLNGRRLSGKPQHGIYIYNGKKYNAK